MRSYFAQGEARFLLYNGRSDDETAEGSSSNTDCDQDNEISFMEDTDEEIDTGEIDEADCIECVKRSTSVAVKRMKSETNPMLD